MSRCYQMAITLEGYEKSNQPKIIAAAQKMWAGLEMLDKNACLVPGKGWVMADFGEDRLCGGKDEAEFAQEFAQSIWQANQGFCKVEVEATYLEDLPYETYRFEQEDYQKLVGVDT